MYNKVQLIVEMNSPCYCTCVEWLCMISAIELNSLCTLILCVWSISRLIIHKWFKGFAMMKGTSFWKISREEWLSINLVHNYAMQVPITYVQALFLVDYPDNILCYWQLPTSVSCYKWSKLWIPFAESRLTSYICPFFSLFLHWWIHHYGNVYLLASIYKEKALNTTLFNVIMALISSWLCYVRIGLYVMDYNL